MKILPNQHQQQPEMPEDDPYLVEPPDLGMQGQEYRGGTVFPNQDQSFLKWLFNFKEEAVNPLRHVWQGDMLDYDTKRWVLNKRKDGTFVTRPLMNQAGINWGISLIESYMNPVFIVTDFDLKTYHFTMREACNVIWNSLCLRYKDFALLKSDIPRVAEEIESKIRAILRGALDDGYRNFFSTQNQNIETRNLSNQGQQRGKGVVESLRNMFRKTGDYPVDYPGGN